MENKKLTIEDIEKHWNITAQVDVKHYIAWTGDWSGEEGEKRFYKQGAIEVDKKMRTLKELENKGVMLEIGCGIGRQTKQFSKYFDKVIAVDISDNMIKQATEKLSENKNIDFRKIDGIHLKDIKDNSIDFVYSYIVFQHIPLEIAHTLLKELARVLKPGGTINFQFYNFKKEVKINSPAHLQYLGITSIRDIFYKYRIKTTKISGLGEQYAWVTGVKTKQTKKDYCLYKSTMLYLQNEIFTKISKRIPCLHFESQIIDFTNAFIKIPETEAGCIVEAGTFKGGSAAKFSIMAKMVNRKLVIFDSFRGLPSNQEKHEKSILGHSIKGWFEEGKMSVPLDIVKENVKKYGEIEVCYFVAGWFKDTLPKFDEKIAAIYLDVDLAESTRTCIKYLYPLLITGGVMYSQDGDFPLVIEVFEDDKFWEEEVGCRRPYVEGLGKDKLIKIIKQ